MMGYILYILSGIVIILGVDIAITAFWAVHDILENREEDNLDFASAFKKYFVKNNNIPTDWSELFNR